MQLKQANKLNANYTNINPKIKRKIRPVTKDNPPFNNFIFVPNLSS